MRGYGWTVFGVIVLTVLIVFRSCSIAFAARWTVALDSRGSASARVVSETPPFIALAWTYDLLRAQGSEGSGTDRSRLSSAFVSSSTPRPKSASTSRSPSRPRERPA